MILKYLCVMSGGRVLYVLLLCLLWLELPSLLLPFFCSLFGSLPHVYSRILTCEMSKGMFVSHDVDKAERKNTQM